MMTIIHESGFGAWASLIIFFMGIAAVLTVGRAKRRPGSVAAAFAVAVLASGAIGVGTGQRNVDRFVQQTQELGEKVEILSVGTREASANLLLSGGCAMVLVMLGGAMALVFVRRDASTA